MKPRRRLLLMVALSSALVAGCALTNYLLNPYGAWGIALVNPLFRKVVHEHLVTPYMLRRAKPSTLLVGSSRVLMGMRIEQGYRDGVMNAALSAITMPQAAAVIDTALENPRLERIIWGLDFFGFNRRWDREDQELKARMAGRLENTIEDTLLSSAALRDSLSLFTRSLRGRRILAPTMTASIPWPMVLICKEFSATANRGLKTTSRAQILDELSEDVPDYAGYQLSRAFLKLFRNEIEKARKRGVQVGVFIPPMSEYELEEIRQNGQWSNFQDFKRELASASSYWDFSGYNETARTDAFFTHVMHFKVAAGQEILRIVLGMPVEPCNPLSRILAQSAIYVTRASIANELAMQDGMRERVAGQQSRYLKLAAAAIARRTRNRENAPPENVAFGYRSSSGLIGGRPK